MERFKRSKPSHTKVLIDELTAELGAYGYAQVVAGAPIDWRQAATRAVRFVVERYPEPSRTQVMCDMHGGFARLLHIHRRPITNDFLRPGSADCDVNPVNHREFVYLCNECVAEYDKKHKGA